MLDTEKKGSISNVAGVSIYEDDEKDNSFYLLAESPHLLVVDGKPQIDLMIHGNRDGDEFEPRGGFLSCTTSVGPTPEQRRLAEEVLREAIAGPDCATEPKLTILGVDWRKGKAALQLATGVWLNGQPSLTGDNACVFRHTLSGAEAKVFDARWRDEGCELEVVYELTATARGKPGGVLLVLRGSLALSTDLYADCVRHLSL